MATLVLGGLGSLVGGPLGGAVGALLGRQVDSAIIGTPSREGPRLKDLAVSTSSYGQPIARHFGRVRTPGTIIWSTDLVEVSETSGGKGKPKTTQYSYSISFAVAVSSRPIDDIGRIWADGNLLRGAAGDLKTGGSLRIYRGLADQLPDPLMAAALGARCPAYRGCAYVVFEDLQLADFGNRIPALSFEVFAGAGRETVGAMVAEIDHASGGADIPALEGFTQEGGTLAQVLSLVDRLKPLDISARGGALLVKSAAHPSPTEAPLLSSAARWTDGEFGRDDGVARARQDAARAALAALRYYDPARDYQPGLQRSDGPAAPSGRQAQLEFPGVMSADNARGLLRETRTRESAAQESLSWRVAELDPAIGPGAIVRAPGMAGLWRVMSWEWREGGIELQLVRSLDLASAPLPTDPGTGWLPRDLTAQSTRLRVFEVPWDGIGAADEMRAYAALGAPAGPWSGATLYAQQGVALEPIGTSSPRRALSGVLTAPLAPGQSIRLERQGSVELKLDDTQAELASVTVEALARGANRLLVGEEILQFANAEPRGAGEWRLTDLLRGRGGTEDRAQVVRPAQTPVTLLDDRLMALGPAALVKSSGGTFAAIGLADAEPVTAVLENSGASRRPPFPCHPGMAVGADGDLLLSWARRARGGWAWLDSVEQPLVEQVEAYDMGIGNPVAPSVVMAVAETRLHIPATIFSDWQNAFGGQPLWVRQRGSFSNSAPLLLGSIPLPN